MKKFSLDSANTATVLNFFLETKYFFPTNFEILPINCKVVGARIFRELRNCSETIRICFDLFSPENYNLQF